MRPVIRVSLNGRALQLEDDAHALLVQYLESAGRTLDRNPDRAEILADLEAAIADKSARFVGPARDVLNREQIATVLDEVGPVEPAPNGIGSGGQSDGQSSAASSGASAGMGSGTSGAASPRQLQQITDGAMISGVCNGLAAWSSLDVTVVRIIAVILAFATGGAAVLAYLLLMFVLPYAPDSGATQGLPRASRSLVERLRGQTAAFASSDDWQRFRTDARDTWARTQARARREWEALRNSRAASTAGAPGDGRSDPNVRALVSAESSHDASTPSPIILLALIVLLIAAVALA